MNMHTKNRITKYMILICMVVCVCLFAVKYESRADINGAESQVIGAACSTFYYDGEYYRVKDTYIYQLSNALDTQYDLTQSQANACIDYIYNNVGAGIASGYLYKVTDEAEDTTENAEDTSASTGNDTTNKQEEPAKPNNNETANANPIPNAGSSQVVTVEKKDSGKAKEDALKGAAELAADMGVNIKYDNGKEGITITDQSGNVLISTREAIKNTGFRLNSLVVYVVLIIVVLLAMSVVVFKMKLLERDFEDEETD